MRAASYIVAAAFLTAGVAMVVGIFAADSTGGRVACLVLALICLPIGVGALYTGRSFGRVANLAATKPGGDLGRGTILTVEDAGITVGDNSMLALRLSVQAGSLPDYEVTIKQMLPTSVVPRLTAGRVVAVWVDIHDSDKVAVDLSARAPRKRRTAVASVPRPAAGSAGPASTAAEPADAFALADARAREAHILANGSPGRAVVIRATAAVSTPDGTDHAPLVTYELNVQPDDGTTPYIATVTSTTPPDVTVPAPGGQVSVKIAPGPDHDVAIDWTATAPS